MKKLSLDDLENKAESIVSLELLNSISGGTENSCHDNDDNDKETEKVRVIINTGD